MLRSTSYITLIRRSNIIVAILKKITATFEDKDDKISAVSVLLNYMEFLSSKRDNKKGKDTIKHREWSLEVHE